jgi:hypothetical protein
MDTTTKHIEIDLKRQRVEVSNRLPGKKYEAHQHEDTSWDVFDVEVIANRPVPTIGGGEFNITKEWLTNARDVALARFQRDSYLPPLHIHHHEPGKETICAGKFFPKSVKLGSYQGEAAWILYCDLINVPDEIYQEIRRGGLSYRSAEILDIRSTEVDSLALLRDETPYFRWPMLSIGVEHRLRVDPRDSLDLGDPVRLKSPDSPFVACRSIGRHGLSVLSCFNNEKGTSMDNEHTEEVAAMEPTDEESVQMMDIPDLLEQLKALAPTLNELLGVISSIGNGGGEELAPEPVEMAEEATEEELLYAQEEEDEEDAVSVSPVELKDQTEAVTLKAQVSNLEDQLKKLEDERELDKLVNEGCAKLSAFGIDRKTAETQIREIAAEHGNAFVPAWLSARSAGLTPAPSMNHEELAAGTVDEDVAALLNGNAAQSEQVVRLSRQYDELTSAGAKLSGTKAQFIERNMIHANGVAK